MEEKTELDKAKEILTKEVGFLEVFERLKDNQDFQIFKEELIDKKVDELIAMLSNLDLSKEMNTGIAIQNQIQALKGLMTYFEDRLKRKPDVQNRLKELNN